MDPGKERYFPGGMILLSRSSRLSAQLLFGACLLAVRHGAECAGDAGEMMSTAGLQGVAGSGRGVFPLGTSKYEALDGGCYPCTTLVPND